MFDTAGSRLSFTVTGGIAETFRVSFWVGTREHDVTGATFSAALFEAHGAEHRQVAVIPVQHDERTNAVLLSVPPLAAGHYLWELRATDPAGEEVRLLYGVLTALSADDVLDKIQAADESELRELAVQQAGGSADSLVLRWQACSTAALQAAEAARSAEAAARAAERAEAAALQAAAHAAAAHADSEEIRVVNELWQQKIERVVWCNEDTGTWWVYERDTHASYRGEDGKSPYIGETGTWWVYDTASKQFVDSGEQVRGEDGRSPYINAAGNWVRWDDAARAWVDTGVCALGRDGIDGTAVRFLLVDSYEDIPQSGETCNGGIRYLVRKEGWAVIGEPAATGSGEWDALELPAYLLPSEFTHLRVPVMNDNATPMYLAVRTSTGELLGLSKNSVTWNVGDVVTWEFAEAVRVPNGATVQLFLSGAVNPGSVRMTSLMANEGVCRVRYDNVWYSERTPYLLAWGAGASDFYEVYAWVEYDGSAGWVRVDRTNELATARVYGTMKYATDMTVYGGAPVGRNAEGQACVPIAGYSMPGALRPSLATTLSSGGACGVDVDGRVWVQPCALGRYGAGKPSFNGTAEVACVGLMPDGSFGLPWATLDQGGVTKLGSRFNELNPIPYIVGVGATPDHQLANNLLFGGALQHQMPAGWTALGMDWMSGEHLEESSYYLGLATSEQFTQSRLNGLELLPASFSLLGGVRLASVVTETGHGVPTAAVVYSFLHANYYSKQEVYSREETYSKAEVDGIDRQIREDAATMYKTVEAAKSDHDALSGRIDGCMKKTASVERIEALPQGQYNRLPQVGGKTLYLIVEE